MTAFRLGLLIVAGALPLPAWAGSPEVDALAQAVQRGLPAAAIIPAIEGLPPLSSEDVVELLRAGVTPATLQEATMRIHPTPEEQALATAQGVWVAPVHAISTPGYDADDAEDDQEDRRRLAREEIDEVISGKATLSEQDKLDQLWKRRNTARIFAITGLGLETIGLVTVIAGKSDESTKGGAVLSVLGGLSLAVSWVY